LGVKTLHKKILKKKNCLGFPKGGKSSARVRRKVGIFNGKGTGGTERSVSGKIRKARDLVEKSESRKTN